MFVDKPEQVSLLKAEVAFARKTDGELEPFRYLGIAPKVEFSAMGDDVEEIIDPRQVSTSPYKRIRRKRVPEFSLGLKAINPDNLALVYAGTVAEYVQTATPVVDEQLGTVRVGGIYKLTKVNVNTVQSLRTNEGTPVSFVENTHYTIDKPAGVIEVIALPATVDETHLLQCSYTPTLMETGVSGWNQVLAGTEPRVEGRLMLVGSSADGEKRLVQIWNVDLSMDGAMPFVTENSSEFGLKVTVLTDDGHANLWEDLQLTAPSA